MHSLNSKFLLTTFCLSLAPVVAANPDIASVSGDVDDGNTITISGSNFGSRPTASPILWDTFESGSDGAGVGTNLATIGDWDVGNGSNQVRYSSARPHAGTMGTLHRFSRSPDVYNVSLAKNGNWSTMYLDYWVSIDYPGPKSRNWKLWRLYDTAGVDMANHVFWCNGGYVDMSGVGDWWPSSMGHYSDDAWYHVQLVLQTGPNGKAKYYFNGEPYIANRDNANVNTNRVGEVRIGHYWATDPADECVPNDGADIYVDNVYIDSSLSRIEIGDAPTYNASRHREIQIPVTWNASGIQVTVNTGSFGSGENAYLFVIDSNDQVSAGYPIVIGQSAGNIIRPMPPEGLSASD